MKLRILCLVMLCVSGYAQSLKRQTIASSSGSKSVDGVIINQTSGQPYQTQSTQSGNISYRPGFQQPVFDTKLIKTTLQVRVVPNPVLLSFLVECSDTLNHVLITTYDETGRIVYTENVDSFTKHEIQCAHWANGAYIITITDKKNNLISTKLIKYQ